VPRAIDTRIRGRARVARRPQLGVKPPASATLNFTVQAIGSTSPPTLPQGAGDDVQARAPRVPVGLSRVGVTGVEKVVRIHDELFFARLDCFVDLSREQKGAHMSRFDEVVNETIREVVLS